MPKYQVRLVYSGFITLEIEAKSENDAWDKAQEIIKGKEFRLDYFEEDNGSDTLFSNTEIAGFLESLERWEQADEILKIEPGSEPDEDRVDYNGPTLPGGVLVLDSDTFKKD